MGGNALKKIHTKRLESPDELRRVQTAVAKTLTAHNLAFAFPIDLPGKTSFGDVDVLVDLRSPAGNVILQENQLQEWMNAVFTPEEIFVSGTVYSMAYESQYQVDLIVVNNLDMARFYFSYGELGAVLGRCSRRHGLTYGHNGLLTVGVNGDRQILLTQSPRAICDYFDLDFDVWERGFTTIEEINHWVTACNIFHPSLFESLNMSHRRQSLRPYYRQFLDHIASLPIDCEWNIRDRFDHAVLHFNKQEALFELEEEKRAKSEFKAKFNAKLFMERGVPTCQLANTMNSFKKVHLNIEEMNAVEICKAVESFLQLETS
jgi:hypothetical protein